MNKKRLLNVLKVFLKISFSIGLIYWLISSGTLDIKSAAVLFQDSRILLFNTLLWAIGMVLLGGTRWFVLLLGIGLTPEYKRTIQLHATGLFFNAALPGAVGGDLVKAIYILRDQSKDQKTHALITVLLDRVIGMYGLFTVAIIASILNWQMIITNSVLTTLMFMTIGIFLGITVLISTVFLPFTDDNDPLVKLLSKDLPLFGLVKKIYLAFRGYKHSKKNLFFAYVISIGIQSSVVIFFYIITSIISDQTIPVYTFFAIVPMGILITALPLAPGGLGVGHVAFEKLFLLMNLDNGANVFNILFIGQMAMNLLGFIPYLLLKTKTPIKISNIE